MNVRIANRDNGINQPRPHKKSLLHKLNPAFAEERATIREKFMACDHEFSIPSQTSGNSKYSFTKKSRPLERDSPRNSITSKASTCSGSDSGSGDENPAFFRPSNPPT